MRQRKILRIIPAVLPTLCGGAVNTAMGYSLILALDYMTALPSNLANALGYAVMIPVGFLVMQRFHRERGSISRGFQYAFVVGFSFGLNQFAVYQLLLTGLPTWAVQLLALACYGAVATLLLRWWVFGGFTRHEDGRQPIGC